MYSKKGYTAAAFLSNFTFAVGLTIISALLVPISKEFHFSVDQSGILFTASYFGFILFNLTFSVNASRVNKKWVLIACTFVYAIFNFLITTASTFSLLIFYMVIVGGVGGIIQSLSADIITQLNKEKQSFYFNFTQVFFGIGALLGPLSAGYLDGKGESWRLMFYFTTIVGLISTALLIFFKTDEIKNQKAIELRDVTNIFKIKEFDFIVIAMILYVGCEVSVWGWISTLLKQQFKISSFQSSWSVALFWGFMIIGRLLTSKLTRTMKLKKIILVLSGIGTVFTFLISLSKTETMVWMMIALIGLSYSGIWATILAYSKIIAGKYNALSIYIVVAAGGVGGMIFPYLMGVVGKASSISITLGVISIGILFVFALTAICKTDA